MKLIRQRNELDCGYAVAAMLAGVDYYTAGEADPTPGVWRGMYCAELAMMLGALTGNAWKVTKRGYGKSVREYRAAGGPVAAVIRPPGIARNEFGHWIVLNRYVYDPEFTRRQTYEEYERGDWIIARILTPAPASP